MSATKETIITIQLVNGGYVLRTPTGDNGDSRTEVFTSTAKLNKAVRNAVDEYTLVPKRSNDSETD